MENDDQNGHRRQSRRKRIARGKDLPTPLQDSRKKGRKSRGGPKNKNSSGVQPLKFRLRRFPRKRNRREETKLSPAQTKIYLWPRKRQRRRNRQTETNGGKVRRTATGDHQNQDDDDEAGATKTEATPAKAANGKDNSDLENRGKGEKTG